MQLSLNLFGMEEIKKTVKKVANFHLSEPDWGDIYEEYIDFNVCAQTW